MSTFAERVCAERERQKMSQDDLSKAAGVSQSTIAQIERGRNKGTKHILALARALRVSPEWLESGKGHRLQLNLTKLGDLPSEDDPEPGSPFVTPIKKTDRTPAAQLIALIQLAEEKGVPDYLFDSLSAALRIWLSQPGVTEDARGD